MTPSYPALSHTIKKLWQDLTCQQVSDSGTLIGLPNPYIVPSIDPIDGFVYREQYYWDSYFVVRALLHTGQSKLALGMVDNLLYLLGRFGFVPNANRFYMLSRSQPPMLSQMVRLVHESGQVNRQWLASAYELLKQEYAEVWMSGLHPHNRQVYQGLSRYYDINVVHALAEAESGWDQTTRFSGRCLDFLPIDLNVYLAIYEQDLSFLAQQLQFDDSLWKAASASRLQTIKSLMWNQEKAWFYDYDYINQCQSEVLSLAGIYPLLLDWDEDFLSAGDRLRLVKTLNSKLETNHGLLATELPNDDQPTQWVSPNGWAPLHVLAVDALLLQGFKEDALRAANKWCHTIELEYSRSGLLLEKYNIVDPTMPPKAGHYPSQRGFAWTNASYVILDTERRKIRP